MTQDASPRGDERSPVVAHDRPATSMPDPARLARPWLGGYPPGVPPTYHYPAVALTRFLDDAARDFPTALAVRGQKVALTYLELLEQVDRLAAALAAWEVEPGDRVAVALPNVPATPVVMFGTWRAGAICVPLDPHLASAVVRDRLATTGARVLIATPEVVGSVGRDGLPALERVVVATGNEWRRWRPSLRRRPRRAVRTLTAALDAAPRSSTPPDVAARDLAVIQHTGGGHATDGGSGRPVALSHANLVANSFQARLWVPDVRAGSERLLAGLPFVHPYGLTLGLLTAVLAAATLELLASFEARRALELIDRRRPTLFPATPDMYRSLVERGRARRQDLRSLRACVSGGAPLPGDVIRRFQRLTGGARVREGYGCTEAAPLTHANPIYGRGHPGSIGLPVTDTVAAIVDPTRPRRVLEAGAVGELAVHGPQVAAGYWAGPDAALTTTDRAGRVVLRDGWLLTGDLASQGSDGQFVWHGRCAAPGRARHAGPTSAGEVAR